MSKVHRCPAHGYPLPCDKCGTQAILSKQDEIREWAFVFLRPRCVNDEHAEAYVNDFLRGMPERGVVVKVDRKLPSIFDSNEDCMSALEYKCNM